MNEFSSSEDENFNFESGLLKRTTFASDSCSVPYQIEALDLLDDRVNTFNMNNTTPQFTLFLASAFIFSGLLFAGSAPFALAESLSSGQSQLEVKKNDNSPAKMPTDQGGEKIKEDETPTQNCVRSLEKLNIKQKIKGIESICKDAKELPGCVSVEGRKIFYFDHPGVSPQTNGKADAKPPQRILSISLIHGDEEESAGVTLAWIDRLNSIQPRNSWRVIPILNPDGWAKKTRTNAHGVDVNRNFPSKDWHETALKYWKSETNQSARRFPGDKPASEPETKCAMAQIEDFKPDFIISIHTPLGVLDFDGPKVTAPSFAPLPWVSLGNFPGSLGRYMWIDRSVPVLTVELKQNGLKHLEEFDRLQDVTGTVAIQAEKLLKKKKESNAKAATKAKTSNQ
jgi:protein MpaA